jgi:hypothetical protein
MKTGPDEAELCYDHKRNYIYVFSVKPYDILKVKNVLE